MRGSGRAIAVCLTLCIVLSPGATATSIATDYGSTDAPDADVGPNEPGAANQTSQAGATDATRSQAADPRPEITDVSVPDRVTIGETVTVEVTAENRGGQAGEFSTIAVSSPSLDESDDASHARVVSHDLGYDTIAASGDTIYTADEEEIQASYLLAEAGTTSDSRWEAGATHAGTFEFTPQETGTFVVYVRTTLSDEADPTRKFTAPRNGDATDQQDFAVRRYEVTVTEPIRRQAAGDLRNVSEAYDLFYEYTLNAEQLRERSQDYGRQTMEAVIPNVEDVGMEYLSRAGDVQSPSVASNLLTLTRQSISLYLSVRLGAVASLMESSGYGPGSYDRLRSQLDSLRENTRALEDHSLGDGQLSGAEGELLRERMAILERLYETQSLYEANIRANANQIDFVDPSDSLIGPILDVGDIDEDDYRAIRRQLDALEATLIVDYYATQAVLNPSPDYQYENLSAVAGGEQPSYPDPTTERIDAPDQLTVGETATVTMTVRNDGATADWQSIAASFPDAQADDVEITEQFSGADYASVLGEGETAGAAYGQREVSLEYPLAEVGGRWEGGQTRSITVSVTPRETGTFRIYAKSVAQAGSWSAAPPIGEGDAVDQQAESVVVREIPVTAANEPPTAGFSVDPTDPTTGETVTFDASESDDSDGEVRQYAWDFNGDGSVDATTDSPTTTNTYRSAGEYDVTLTVTDDSGTTASDSVSVTVTSDTPTETATETATETPPDTDTETPTDTVTETSTETPTDAVTETATETTDTVTETQTEASANEGSISLSANASQTVDGEHVRVTFEVRNTGSEPQGALLEVGGAIDDLSGNWTIANRTDDAGAWRNSQRVWFFQNLAPDDPAEPSILLSPPEEASGNYSLRVRARTDEANASDGVGFAIRETPLLSAVDRNDNGRIDDAEILDAIEWWRTDQRVPDTDLRISNMQILELTDVWREGGSFR